MLPTSPLLLWFLFVTTSTLLYAVIATFNNSYTLLLPIPTLLSKRRNMTTLLRWVDGSNEWSKDDLSNHRFFGVLGAKEGCFWTEEGRDLVLEIWETEWEWLEREDLEIIISACLCKLTSLCYKCNNTTTPDYWSELQEIYKPTCILHSSANTFIPCLPSVCTHSFGQRSFFLCYTLRLEQSPVWSQDIQQLLILQIIS